MSNTFNYFDGLTWDAVVWSTSYNKIRRIQKRIYKASFLNDKSRVWFLQKVLLKNPHAKLLAVAKVTNVTLHKNDTKIDFLLPISKEEKILMAKVLKINGKANIIKRGGSFVAGRKEKFLLDIPFIQDKAKQALCKLALEPEWEAKFDLDTYGFRPGKNIQKSIKDIDLHFNSNKYVFNSNIHKCFSKINQKTLITKLGTFPLIENQIRAWLDAGILSEYAQTEMWAIPNIGIIQDQDISFLLVNVILHDLEKYVLNDVLGKKTFINFSDISQKMPLRREALKIIKYGDKFVIIHKNLQSIHLIIQQITLRLFDLGLNILEGKSTLKLRNQTFSFFGFQIIGIKTEENFHVKIRPSKRSVLQLISKTKTILQTNKAASAYQLIVLLYPILLDWGMYFQFCECKKTFLKIDNIVYQQLRAWVFRRAVRQTRSEVKEKYFPRGKIYNFQGHTYKTNWILNGSKKSWNGEIRNIYLPKLSWIKRKKDNKYMRTFCI
nr:HNH endonuclease [Cryptomonas borealis]